MKTLDIDSTVVAAIIGAAALTAINLMMPTSASTTGDFETTSVTTPIPAPLTQGQAVIWGAIVGAIVQTGVRLTGVS